MSTATGSTRRFLRALLDGESSICTTDETLSGEELTLRVGAVARELRGKTRLAVMAYPSVDTLVTIAGILLAGATAVPINPALGEAERAHILRDSQAELLPAGFGPGLHAAAPDSIPADKSEALILYTSGSTGPPKGVILSRHAIATNLGALADTWEWSAEDTVVHALPLSHVHGLVFGGLGPLHIGGRLHHTGRFLRSVPGGSLYFGVPATWASMRDSDLASLRRARLLISGAAPLTRPVFDRVHAFARHRILNRYAMTECLVITSQLPSSVRTHQSVGIQLPTVRVRLVSDRDDVPGLVEVTGPSVLQGYVGMADALTKDGWFRTGDVGCWNDQGELELIGRMDTDLIKTGGYRVGAGEIEAVLLACPGVQDAAVRGVPDGPLGQRIAAWVVCSEPSVRDTLQQHLASQLAHYKQPAEIHFVADLPRNALGKLQKHLLR